MPLLVSEAAAEVQGEAVPGSVRRHLAATPPPPPRLASFHAYVTIYLPTPFCAMGKISTLLHDSPLCRGGT